MCLEWLINLQHSGFRLYDCLMTGCLTSSGKYVMHIHDGNDNRTTTFDCLWKRLESWERTTTIRLCNGYDATLSKEILLSYVGIVGSFTS